MTSLERSQKIPILSLQVRDVGQRAYRRVVATLTMLYAVRRDGDGGGDVGRAGAENDAGDGGGVGRDGGGDVGRAGAGLGSNYSI